MQIFCDKCGVPQRDAERHCVNCGKVFGGEWWIIPTGAAIALFLPALILFAADRQFDRASVLKIVFWYAVPVIVMTAFLYDYHPKRRAFYFWGGAIVIAVSLFRLLQR